jgi:hypothetical protein
MTYEMFLFRGKKEKKRCHVFEKQSNWSCVGVLFFEIPAFCTPEERYALECILQIHYEICAKIHVKIYSHNTL